MKLFTKQKQIHCVREQTCGDQGEEWGEEIDWEFGIETYTLLYLKETTSKDLPYSTENSA